MTEFPPLNEGNSPTLGKTGAVYIFSPPLLQMHSGHHPGS